MLCFYMSLLFGDCCTYSIFWSTHPVLDWFYPHFRTVYTSQWLTVKPLFWCACWWYPINNAHCIPIYMYIYIYTCTVYMNVNVSHTHTHTHTHTHIYIYIHIHIIDFENLPITSPWNSVPPCFLLKSHVTLPLDPHYYSIIRGYEAAT